MSFLRGVGPFKAAASRTLSSHARLQSLKATNAPVDIHPEIEEALAHNKPVVALETALVSHGLPFPSSLEVPLSLERTVRSTGAIPATIGIIGGRVKVGLERHELSRLADPEKKSGNAAKISRRDIAAAIATGADGGTTCSATLVFAALAGIKVFATGGLGGVHRGGENSMDVSADLQELTRCPVGLVSSGVKSILDIKRTLEYLESLGVPVLSYGKSREFPAFFSRHSGYNVPWNVDNPLTAAKVLYTQAQLGMQNGALIAVPIPEEYEAAGEKIQEFVNQAVLESEKNGVSASGNDATPWLLSRIAELSNGQSLISNIALLENTALIGGQIAVNYQKLVDESPENKSTSQSFPPSIKSKDGFKSAEKTSTANTKTSYEQSDLKPVALQSANVVIVGSAAIDITAQGLPNTNPALAAHSTAPGHVRLTLGGVGRNIAEATHRVMQARSSELSSLLVAPIGADSFGQLLANELKDIGMRTDGLIIIDKPTAVCNMVLDGNGTLIGGVADMAIVDSMNTEDIIHQVQMHQPSIIALDGNLPPAALEALVLYGNNHNIPVLFEPTSTLKCTKILPAVMTALERKIETPIAYATPNLLELTQLYETANQILFEVSDHPYHSYWWSIVDSLNLGSAFRNNLERLARYSELDGKINLQFLLQEGTIQKAIQLLPLFQHLIIKCGDQGVLIVMRIDAEASSKSGWLEHSSPDQQVIVSKGRSGELLVVQHISALTVDSLVNVTGAGDSFVGALLATLAQDPAVLYQPKTLRKAILTSQKAAILTLQSQHAVSPQLSELKGA